MSKNNRIIECPTCRGLGKVDNPIYPTKEDWDKHKGTQTYWERWSYASVNFGDGFGRYTKIYAIGKNNDNTTYTINTEETSCPSMSYSDMCKKVKLINRKSGNQETFDLLVNKKGLLCPTPTKNKVGK